MRSSLTLLAALGAALALAGVGDGADSDRPESDLDPNVAFEIRAARPAQTLPGALRGVAAETESPELAHAIRTELATPASAGLELERLLSRFSYLILRIEPSCPPPAVLGCRPAVRVIAILRGPAAPFVQREVGAVLVAGLRAAGFKALRVREHGNATDLTAQITSRGETLARWRTDDRVLEVATGGLALRGEHPAPTPPLRIKMNSDAITELFGD